MLRSLADYGLKSVKYEILFDKWDEPHILFASNYCSSFLKALGILSGYVHVCAERCYDRSC